MRKVSAAEKESAESLFGSSIYTNRHLGWLDCWDLPEQDCGIWLDEDGSRHVLFAVQSLSPDLFWLHNFYADFLPEGYPLFRQLRMVLPRGRSSVYTISSHKWFSDLLHSSGFRCSDEIIQMETADISIKQDGKGRPAAEIIPFSREYAGQVYNACEQAFPPLWRLKPREFLRAFDSSNYRRILLKEKAITGYLLAEITDDNCDITRLAVAPSAQNLGMGTAVITQLVQDSLRAGITNFSVNTNRNNKQAMKFYDRFNFKRLENTYPVFHRYIYIH